ncbi:type II toxin-antitoxin system MqsA family antitoxin [Bradyrhizobium sp. RDT10]
MNDSSSYVVEMKSEKIEQSPLGPQDVRRIREKLGLSQVEAGELLGGGPRAFTKYEGKVTPASSVMNLLRMLDADPAALGALTGQKLHPIEADGLRPFEVTGQHVAALSERKLIGLLRRLLTAEAHSENLPTDQIHAASVLTAPDGGVDANIAWEGDHHGLSIYRVATASFS